MFGRASFLIGFQFVENILLNSNRNNQTTREKQYSPTHVVCVVQLQFNDALFGLSPNSQSEASIHTLSLVYNEPEKTAELQSRKKSCGKVSLIFVGFRQRCSTFSLSKRRQ